MTAKPNWRDQQRVLREEAILDAAHELLAERGYSVMSMDDVAAQVGISKATLYQHFPSKEELAVRTVVRRINRTIALIRDQNAALSAIDRLEEVVQRILENRYSKSRCTPVHPTGMMPSSLLRDHPLYQEAQHKIETLMAKLVDEAKAQGDVYAHYPTIIIVQMFFSYLRDTSFETLVRSGAVSPQELTDTLMEMVFHGLKRRNDADSPHNAS
jgi:TetR/AcrR family transcriptional regulator of autoinduction and epiphytic fitness